MRTLSAPALALLESGHVGLAQLILLEHPGGDVALATSTWSLDHDGVTYLGANGLGTFSAVVDAIGEPQGFEWELSALDSASISLALDDAAELQGSPFTVRTALLAGTDYQIVDAPIEWRGYADTMEIEESGEKAVIRGTVESDHVDLLRSRPLTSSDADHQTDWPGDLAFEFKQEQIGKTFVWPAREWFFR